MDSVAPAPARYRTLDHWRGVACLLVIVYHSTMMRMVTPFAPGDAPRDIVASGLLALTTRFNAGVALFFVISGYCITAAAMNAQRRNHRLRWYFFRRFRRIYPPFWVIVAFSAALFLVIDYGWAHPLLSSTPWAQPRPWWYSPSQWFGNLTLTETWRHYMFGDGRAHFPGQAWTLCYEEQFYFVTGLLLLTGRRFFAGALAVTGLTIVAMAASRATGIAIDGFFFDGSWLLFAAGILVYFQIACPDNPRALWIQVFLVVSAAVSVWYPAMRESSPGFVLAAALPVLHRFDRATSSARILVPLRICGEMCYSLYLVHQLLVKAASTLFLRYGVTGAWATLLIVVPSCVALSAVVGWLFHVTVERRFLNTPVERVDLEAALTRPQVAVA